VLKVRVSCFSRISRDPIYRKRLALSINDSARSINENAASEHNIDFVYLVYRRKWYNVDQGYFSVPLSKANLHSLGIVGGINACRKGEPGFHTMARDAIRI
ncbi:MAG TPA: hypothetical protein VLG46_06790, partial [Anaerolineae bacterium]|nr:hypothetical protein [Anaerolineae bacterium]